MGYVVYAARAERVAAGKTFQSQPAAAPYAEALNGFARIIRAGRIEAAGGRQEGGHSSLVYAQNADQGLPDSIPEQRRKSFMTSCCRVGKGQSMDERRGLITMDHGEPSWPSPRRTASRKRRLMRLRTTAGPSARGTVKPMRGPAESGSSKQNAAKKGPATREPRS